MGISPEEFYTSTPAELHLKAEGYLEGVKRHAEMQATITAVGVHNAMSKKKVKLFKEERPIGRISPEEKAAALKEIMET